MKNMSNGLYQNQPRIDLNKLQHVENKISNQEHFEANKDKFSHQCKIVYEALLRGEKLTTSTALILYRIGDLRRRIKDLKDIWNVPIKDQYVQGKFKEYFLINNNQ
jgi:Helix-turn-helix domain